MKVCTYEGLKVSGTPIPILKKRENKFRLSSLEELSQQKRTVEDKFQFHRAGGFPLPSLFRAMGPNHRRAPRQPPHSAFSTAGAQLLREIMSSRGSHSRAHQAGEQAHSPYMHGRWSQSPQDTGHPRRRSAGHRAPFCQLAHPRAQR